MILYSLEDSHTYLMRPGEVPLHAVLDKRLVIWWAEIEGSPPCVYIHICVRVMSVSINVCEGCLSFNFPSPIIWQSVLACLCPYNIEFR